MGAGTYIFDLDGTLVDSLPDIARALIAALADRGRPAPSLAAIRSWIGGGAKQLAAHAAPDDAEATHARFQHHYAQHPVVDSRVYAGVGAALDALVARGVRVAVLTNKPEPLAVPICARLLAPWPFAPIVGGHARHPLKPHPAGALAIAAALGVDPRDCVVVGDSGSDIATARAAGMAAIGVTWGYRARAELAAANPDRLVDDPAELA